MLAIELTLEDGQLEQLQRRSPVLIGRGAECDVRIRGWRVARRHARIYRTDNAILIDDLGSLFGTWVNGKRIGQGCPLQPDDEVIINGCLLHIRVYGNAPSEQTPSVANQSEHGQGFGSAHSSPATLVSQLGHEVPPSNFTPPEPLPLGEVEAFDAPNVDASPASSNAAKTPSHSNPVRHAAQSPEPLNRCVQLDRDDVPTVTTGSGAQGEETSIHPTGSTLNARPDTRISVPKHAQHASPGSSGTPFAHREQENTRTTRSAPSSTFNSTATSTASNATAAETYFSDPAWTEWRRRLHVLLLESLDLRRRDVSSMSDAALRTEADTLLKEIIEQRNDTIPRTLDRDSLRRQVIDEAVGLGPLESLLADPDITEIMVNRYDELYVERKGRLYRHNTTFSSERAVTGVIERIVTPLGRRIDESSPMVDARLKDGSRVNAVIAPIAIKGAALTIRKFPARHLTIDDLLQAAALDVPMVEFLKLCVVQRKNVVISGGTGSGKTTLLNILSNFVPDHERIITIEDAAELRLRHSHLVVLEARPANLEGRGAVSIRDLVRNALRMRPDRIVVGECRGPEALDMLQAMNTGHEGSLTTLHANSPRDALARLETMILMAGMDLPLTAIREQIASSIDIIVQQHRSASGHRRITSITEVTGMESGRIQMQELFKFTTNANGGAFTGCGIAPSFFEDWCARGLAQPGQFFYGSTPVEGPANDEALTRGLSGA